MLQQRGYVLTISEAIKSQMITVINWRSCQQLSLTCRQIQLIAHKHGPETKLPAIKPE